MEEGRRIFKISTGKPTGNRLLGKCMRRWKDNVRLGLKEIDVNIRNWIVSAQCECGIELPGSINHGVIKET